MHFFCPATRRWAKKFCEGSLSSRGGLGLRDTHRRRRSPRLRSLQLSGLGALRLPAAPPFPHSSVRPADQAEQTWSRPGLEPSRPVPGSGRAAPEPGTPGALTTAGRFSEPRSDLVRVSRCSRRALPGRTHPSGKLPGRVAAGAQSPARSAGRCAETPGEDPQPGFFRSQEGRPGSSGCFIIAYTSQHILDFDATF